eukprot:gene4856-biopygen23530
MQYFTLTSRRPACCATVQRARPEVTGPVATQAPAGARPVGPERRSIKCTASCQHESALTKWHCGVRRKNNYAPAVAYASEPAPRAAPSTLGHPGPLRATPDCSGPPRLCHSGLLRATRYLKKTGCTAKIAPVFSHNFGLLTASPSAPCSGLLCSGWAGSPPPRNLLDPRDPWAHPWFTLLRFVVSAVLFVHFPAVCNGKKSNLLAVGSFKCETRGNDTGAGVARAWRGRGAGYGHFLAWGGAGVARTRRGR